VRLQLGGYLLSAQRQPPDIEAQLTLPFWGLWHTMAKCAVLVRPLDCETIVQVLSRWARTPEERTDVFSIKMQWMFTQRMYKEGADLLRSWMALLDFPVETFVRV
jgi:hypothetical protein